MSKKGGADPEAEHGREISVGAQRLRCDSRTAATPTYHMIKIIATVLRKCHGAFGVARVELTS